MLRPIGEGKIQSALKVGDTPMGKRAKASNLVHVIAIHCCAHATVSEWPIEPCVLINSAWIPLASASDKIYPPVSRPFSPLRGKKLNSLGGNRAAAKSAMGASLENSSCAERALEHETACVDVATCVAASTDVMLARINDYARDSIRTAHGTVMVKVVVATLISDLRIVREL